jgi:ketosteroid isomerase-like protein
MSTVDSTEANRQTVRAAFEAWQRGEAPITDVFAPEMTWRIEGHSRAAGDYPDTRTFVDRVLAPFGARFSAEQPFRPTSIRGVHADGDTVIVLWDGHGITVDGSAYDNSYAWFMRLRDGKVVDGVAFFDSISFDRLWTTVRPAA